MTVDAYGRPVLIFYANLLRAGLTLRVDNQKLVVDGNLAVCSPVLQDEIRKRSRHLVDLLSPPPPPALAAYFGRLITLGEVEAALGIAAELQADVDSTPVDGGWLLTTGGLT